jgi:hypothetical protein
MDGAPSLRADRRSAQGPVVSHPFHGGAVKWMGHPVCGLIDVRRSGRWFPTHFTVEL